VPSLVTLVSAILVCGPSDRQTDRQTDGITDAIQRRREYNSETPCTKSCKLHSVCLAMSYYSYTVLLRQVSTVHHSII